MAYNDDDWLNYNLNELTKTDSPPPTGAYYDNIEANENGASPMRDLDVGYSADLAVPLGDFQYSDVPNGGQSQVYQSMHTMQNSSGYDGNMHATRSVEYNSFELPQVVQVNGSQMNEQYTDLNNLDQNNSFYSNQQPSTSEMEMGTQMGAEMDGYQPQQHLMQMQPSTSYMQPVDQDQQMMMQLQQQPAQQPQVLQNQNQAQVQQKPTPKKKSTSTRKKQPAANNSVGAVLTKVNKMSQQITEGSGTRLETRMTPEESMKIAQLMSTMAQLQQEQEQGVDNTEKMNKIQAELANVFAKNLSSTGANTAIVSQIQSLTTTPSQPPAQQINHAPVQPKKAAPKRKTNQTSKNVAPVLQQQQPKMEQPQATIIPANRYGPPDSPTYQPQIVYQTESQQQEILQTMPSTSSAQYMDYTQNGQNIQIVQQQQQGPSPNNKVPSMNSRQHVYRQQVAYQQGPSTPQQSQQQQPQQQVFQGQQVFVQQQGPPIPIQESTPPTTLGDMVKQQQQQRRFQQNQQDSALRQQLLNNGPGSNKSRQNNRRVSINSPQPQPQIQQQVQPQPQSPVQTITVTRENSNMFPNVPIGSVLQVVQNAQAQQPPQQQQQQQQQPIEVPQVKKLEEPEEIPLVEPTEEELAEFSRQCQLEREHRLRQMLDHQVEAVRNPQFTPFEDMHDVVNRLLPFHLYYEPDVSQQAFDDFDDNWFRHNINVDKQKKSLENRIREVCLRGTFIHSDLAENNMLMFLETERERRKLEEDKQAAAENLEAFVENSEIIRKFRNGMLCEEGPIENPIQESENYGDYEYNDFDENFVRIPSPYISPILSPKFSPKKPYTLQSPIPQSIPSFCSPPPAISSEPTAIKTPNYRKPNEEFEASISNISQDPPVAARLPSKKEFLTRARKDVPAALRSPPAQSVSIRHRLISTSNSRIESPKKTGSSTAETCEDSEGSGSPELGIDDDEIYIRPPPLSATLSSVKREPIRPPIKISVPNPKHEPIKLKIKLPPLKLTDIHIKKEVEEIEEPIAEPIVEAPTKKRKSVEVKPKAKRNRSDVVSVENCTFKTPNGVKKDRLVQVMTDDNGGRIKLRMRKVPEFMRNSITPRKVKRRSLEPTSETRLLMTIHKMVDDKYSIKIKETPPPIVQISRPTNRLNSGRAMAIRTDPTAKPKMIKKKKSAENMVETPKAAKFTNRFNPFASIPSTSTMTPRTPAKFLSATPEVTNSTVPVMPQITIPVAEVKPKLKSPNQKISALLPWMTEEPAKKEKKIVVKVEPVEASSQNQANNLQNEISPRASSSMSFLLDDDKTNGVFSFLHSPPRKNEPLPTVEFSDDDDDNDIHTDFSLVTDRICAAAADTES
ncbi:unnamed protein product [Caenorhabditis angaria]|uniref:GLTSCR protein conserved domain-containing protein n=1 Tax=Caenorhabditis angaria TaxID=860376 RepID=A0A9P1INY7_9PELO|nr:unnamed protein product [Caenorhabditis angaria]